jgi:hypothetical protein
MDQDVSKKLEELSKKLDAIYMSSEKTRKYFLWTMIGSLIVFVLPLIGLMFAIPAYLQTLNGITSF